MALPLYLADRTGDRVVDLAKTWSKAILRFSGVRLVVDWKAQVDPAKPYVFMSNHLSTVDIWTLLVVVPQRIRMIAKKQLGRIPLFGWAMRAARFIFIDRANAVAARRSIDVARQRIADGQSVLIFPEGTRSRDGKLAAFKKGGFHLAIEAGVPIVPVALVGTRESMPRKSLLVRGGEVRVAIGAAIPTAGLSPADRHGLVDQVHAAIAALQAEQSAAGVVTGAQPASGTS